MENQKVSLITGANSGIGYHTAMALAKEEHKLIFICRNKEKAEKAIQEISKATGNKDIHLFLADFGSLEEIRKVSQEISDKFAHIDILINNAGLIMGGKREQSKEGIEYTIAVNHLAPFLLTGLLLPLLKKSLRARIINVASEAHRLGKPNFNNFNLESGYSGIKAYGLSKLYNILFTHALSKKLNGTTITTFSVHPGGVASNFGSNTKGWFAGLFRLMKPFFLTSEQGAETSIYLATAKDVEKWNGGYFAKNKLKKPSKEARSVQNEAFLWEISEKLTNLKYEL
jgi:NAD(P)-dependent dehydrogenase (short-subunit alcohol dehydrogenase family)